MEVQVNIVELASVLAEERTEAKWKSKDRITEMYVKEANGDTRYSPLAQDIFNAYYEFYYDKINEISFNVDDPSDELTYDSDDVLKDFVEFVDQDYLNDISDNHLEAWEERYKKHGGNERMVSEDINVNHDDSIQIEELEGQLKRSLTNNECQLFTNLFHKTVIDIWKKGNL